MANPKISNRFHAHKGNYSTAKNTHEYIVIHNTGNSASAISEAKYAHNDQHSSGFHYVLDGKGTIYKSTWLKHTAYSVGCSGWKNAKPIVTNRQSINIEVCSDGEKFTSAEIAELRYLVKKLMKKYNIPASHVVRHYDCHTGHKECPAYYCVKNKAGNFARWKTLKTRITD